MNRRFFLKSCLWGSAALGLSTNAFLCRRVKKRPNFLFILVDDLGWRDLGCYGSSFYETPHVDQLALHGMRFTNAYAACPVCSPTRVSVMTGKYPARLQTTDYFGAPQPETVADHWTRYKPLLPAPYKEHMPLDEVTVAEALKKAGYATFFAGKWHMGGKGFYPENQGYDVNKGGWERGGPYGGKKYFSPYGNPKLEDGPEGEHLPDRLASETCQFIESHQDENFLAFLSFYSVHTPLIAREDLREKYRKKKGNKEKIWGKEGDRKVRLVQNHAVYGGMVEAMDLAVGKIINQLKTLGLYENTVIIFMSDNGGLSTSEGHPTSNLPLRAGKGWLYEGGIREPMIIRWPGMTQPGTQSSEPVMSTDFYPTMLQMAGLPLLPNQHLDGKSLVPLLKKGSQIQERCLFWHYPHYGNQGGSPGSALRCGKYKLIEFFEDNHIELYDLSQDIGERKNLSKKIPEKAAELKEKLHSWRENVGALMPTPNPNAKN